jgi:RNA polymerase sigma factor (sigma-70 family)
MDAGASASYLRDMHTLFDAGTASGLSDRQLLERFAGGGDSSAEAAFETLIQRHGPMVMRVCQTTLGREQADSHDAFQATFLVLVQKSQSIRRLESVGSWLFGVASRLARRARVEAARRRLAERKGGLRLVAGAEPGADAANSRDHDELLRGEVERLPDHLRAVVVLCYWEGLTHEQAAIRLGCPLGTVRSRIARARDLLHRRLSRRGLAPVGAVIVAALDSPEFLKATTLEIPGTLVSSTVQLARQVVCGASIAQLTSPTVATLVESAVGTMLITRLRIAAVILPLIGAGLYGAMLAAQKIDGVRQARRDRVQPSVPAKSKAQPPLKLISEYVVEPPDLLVVEVLEGLPGRLISGERLVRPDGSISLGFYGDLPVSGKTLREIKKDLIEHLRRFLADEQLGLVASDEDTGEPLIDEKTGKIKLIDPRDSDRVFVDVTAYNSKNYYIQGEVNAAGRFPITGQERILDAISWANGLTAEADHEQVVLYREHHGGEPVETLKIDIDQIMQGDDLSTNYQLRAGDRLVVRRRGGDARRADKSAKKPPIPPLKSTPESGSKRHSDPIEEPFTAQAGLPPRSVANPAIERLEKRMDDMERKLDLILESLNRATR